MPSAVGARIEGLKAFTNDLRRWNRNAPKYVSLAHRRIAQRVAKLARAEARSQGGVAAKTAPSIRASGTARVAAVLLGGPKYPFALGAEFGAYRHTYPQFKPWRGNFEDAGYFLYPTVREQQHDIEDTYLDFVLDTLVERAGPIPIGV